MPGIESRPAERQIRFDQCNSAFYHLNVGFVESDDLCFPQRTKNEQQSRHRGTVTVPIKTGQKLVGRRQSAIMPRIWIVGLL